MENRSTLGKAQDCVFRLLQGLSLYASTRYFSKQYTINANKT
ncbi:hypothetical protein [Anabaena catenula]|nr:hypothetical protein [Anabaena catenula]